MHNLSDDQLEYQIIDRARFAESRRQHNTRGENKHIKETAKVPEGWKEKPHKLAQKNVDSQMGANLITEEPDALMALVRENP